VAAADEKVTACGPNLNHSFIFSSAFEGFDNSIACPGGPMEVASDGFATRDGQGAIWQASAPPGLMIVGVTIPANGMNSQNVNTSSTDPYGGNFYWKGGTSSIRPRELSASFGPLASSDFGWLLVCIKASCNQPADIQVFDINLSVRETTPPSLAIVPNTIWQANGWVRGRWPLTFWGSSPSGLCGLNASFAQSALPGTWSPRDTSRWQECLAGPVNDQIVTQDYAQGGDELYLSAWDAAGETVGQSKIIHVDNQSPTLSLAGPTDAPSTAGTQYVRATAAAGPSGVAGIGCRVDGGPATWYPSHVASVPVSGLGEHRVVCQAQNNAVNSSGQRATTPPSSFVMKIGQPTISAVAFSRLVDGLKCHRTTERVRVPAHWTRVRRNGHSVRVHRRAYTKLVHVRHCHVRTVRRRITILVTVRRHGRKVRIREHKVVRVVLRPRRVTSTRKFVAHGHTATVTGWLGTSSGIALGGQSVDVLTAPTDGRSGYSSVAVVTTNADGGWSARIPAGPSRSITAAYAGGPTTEGSYSAPIQLTVPARVELLRVSPRHVAWGGTVRLTGVLKGGYLPPGGALVRLRIGLGHAFTTYGVHEHVGGTGRFTTSYTFGVGDPGVRRTYWFQLASLPMGDYPFAPSSSRRVPVVVGGHRRGR
jgi:hypothetical protein